jgi:hypothetical protein
MAISDAEALRILEGMDWNDREEDSLALAQNLALEELTQKADEGDSAAVEEDVRWQYEELEPEPADRNHSRQDSDPEILSAAIGRSGDATVVISRELLERWISDASISSSAIDDKESSSA